ncbi:(d)CMP kinase [Candidatus Bipolaricaulota bacterium]|nr:(d)CMP kinase [Candidatus Bipolaricaulota bacterium]MBS3813983.1 (d)CMP kinase [Candidatus Bipolaricaulota bacterium]
MQVTIDGPAGVGKTSVGKKVADRFSLLFIQSGQLYRALAYGKLNQMDYSSLALNPEGDSNLELTIGGEEVTKKLTSEEIAEEASKLAKKKEIRALVNDRISRIARDQDVLVEGRDIGTEVLPDAEVKIFLTASAKERAKRRKKQLQIDRPLKDIENGIKKRDERDQNREISPLRPADDAVILNTNSLDESKVVERVASLIGDYLKD